MLIGTSTSPPHTRHQQDRPCLHLSQPATSCDMSRSVEASARISTFRLLTSPRAAEQTQLAAAVADRAQRLCVTLRVTHSNDDDNDEIRNGRRSSAPAALSQRERVRQCRPMPVSLSLSQRLTAAAVAPVARDPDDVLEPRLTANSHQSRSEFLRACWTACTTANAHRGCHTCFVRGSRCDDEASPRARKAAGTPWSRG